MLVCPICLALGHDSEWEWPFQEQELLQLVELVAAGAAGVVCLGYPLTLIIILSECLR